MTVPIRVGATLRPPPPPPACIEVNGGAPIDFGTAEVGASVVQDVAIENCGDEAASPLAISRLDVTSLDGRPSAFAVAGASADALPIVLEPGAASTIQVRWTPSAPGVLDGGMLRIVSNAVPSVLEVPLWGMGEPRVVGDNVCPTAVAQCAVGSGPPSDRLDVVVLDTLTCTAGASTDPDGTIVEYRWEVVARPDDSRAEFASPDREDSELFVDVMGEYALELTVVDDGGCVSPAAAVVTVGAWYDEDIAIQLTWHTPADDDETDTDGSDMDLHFLHPAGSWTESQWDCHFRSISPNWGSPSASDDDPSMDIDDVDGAGPENINLNNPENGVTYRVGVHYWNDHGWGPSIATVKIFGQGRLIYEDSANLTNGQFWDVAALKWPSAEIIVMDREYASIGDAP